MKRVLIFTEPNDTSTDEVMDWLSHYGAEVKRWHPSHWLSEDFSLEFGQTQTWDAVWFRRFQMPVTEYGTSALSSFAQEEMAAAARAFVAQLSADRVLGCADYATLSKWETLKLARALGLNVPKTIVATERSSLLNFSQAHGPIISKALKNAMSFQNEDGSYSTSYTKLLTPSEIEALPERFFPALFQCFVEKTMDVRVFYLDGRCWAAGIIGPGHTDFRKTSNQNTVQPIELELEVKDKINALMKALRLKTGSLDFLWTPKGEYVFLEVNPVGQFGFISHPCNYYLEQEIAKWLLAI